jgi:microcompartment protein CcmL/EutN
MTRRGQSAPTPEDLPALALLEYATVSAGVLAVDRMLKNAPVALLRCGSVHPGRYLALVGGTVAATEVAHAAGAAVGRERNQLLDEVLLPDPHPQLAAAVMGARAAPAGDALGVVEVGSSPGLLRALDAVLKAVPVSLVEVRLADDLGGHALAQVAGLIQDVQEALEMMGSCAGGNARLIDTVLLPRLDDTLRDVLGAGSRFAACKRWSPAGAEIISEES